jgi:hypothetical protein
LAISYAKLGGFYKDLDKAKAKKHYLECKKLWFELVQNFPAYIKFQKNLQWVEGRLKELE